VVRTLETFASEEGQVLPGERDTRLYIRPGYRFRVVDGLITNFHLPRSTLLMLVAAFGGYEPVLEAYREAVQLRYRFFSFGDAMILL
jgi:S-adenosylmethionine:tRNA ribosyltransferase-isomerase